MYLATEITLISITLLYYPELNYKILDQNSLLFQNTYMVRWKLKMYFLLSVLTTLSASSTSNRIVLPWWLQLLFLSMKLIILPTFFVFFDRIYIFKSLRIILDHFSLFFHWHWFAWLDLTCHHQLESFILNFLTNLRH